MKKIILSIFLSFLISFSFAQGVQEGTFFNSYGGKVTVTKQSGGAIKIAWESFIEKKTWDFDYNPNNKYIYDRKKYNSIEDRVIVDFSQKDFIKEINVDGTYKIQSIHIWSKNKKEAKSLAKAEKVNIGKYYVQNPKSEMHQNNVSKIVFFSEKPEFGKEESKVKNTFKVGEPIWAVAYLAKPVGEYGIDPNEKVKLEYGYLEGDNISSLDDFNFVFDKEEVKTRNYIRFEVLPDLISGKADNPMGNYLTTLSQIQKLNPVEYTFVVEVMDIQGTFTLDCADMEVLKKAIAKTEQEEMNKVELPKAGMNNPDLARECLLAIQRWGQAAGWKEKFNKAILTATGWGIVRDDYGEIIGRVTEAACVAKWPDGRCSFQYFNFIQDYKGGGQYAQTVRKYSTGPQSTINCDKVR